MTIFPMADVPYKSAANVPGYLDSVFFVTRDRKGVERVHCAHCVLRDAIVALIEVRENLGGEDETEVTCDQCGEHSDASNAHTRRELT